MWRDSGRCLLRIRQRANLPLFSRPPSAHLGLQSLRLQTHHSSPPTLHGLPPSSSFSTAEGAANVANSSAETEANSSFSRVVVELPPTYEYVNASPAAAATPLTSEEKEADSALTKIVEEHRTLISSLRAELDEQKSLTASILNEIRVVKLKAEAKVAEADPPQRKRPWREWNAFMEYLQHSDYFKDEKKANSLNGGSMFEDPALVKKAIHRFSQAHEAIFESLSQIDLRILARYGCSNADPKVTAAQKRLRQHFHLEDMLTTEDTGDNSTADSAKLSDVTRLLHSTIVEGPLEEDVRSSLSHLLRETITLSRKSGTSSSTSEITPPTNRPSIPLSPSLLEIRESSKMDKIPKEKVEVLEIDAFPGDKRANSGRAETRAEAPSRSKPEWKCPRCSFKNLDTKQRCVECHRRRPHDRNVPDMPKDTDGFGIVDEGTDEDLLVSEKELRKTKERKDIMLSAPSRCESSKARFSVVETEEQYDTGGGTDLEQSMEENVDEDSKDKDPFDVLDRILDSEDSDNDLREESKGSGKKTSISSLFPPAPSAHSRGDKGRKSFGRPERRRFNSRKDEDEEVHGRSKRGFLRDDEEEDSLGDNEVLSRRGRGNGGYSRGPGRGKNIGFRDKGGPRGFRGDSYDEGIDEGGQRSSRSFGNRDRGRRSDSFGRRSSRGI